ncbi:MAG: tetratricopeptide repeat protein [Bacteroidota bacterium]
MKNNVYIYRLTLLLAVIFMAGACSTKKNTFTRRVYHNLTAHYNAYWNGNESLKEGLRELDNMVTDNYAKVLPVFNYGTEEDGTSMAQYMDRAIEKSEKVVRKHSMVFGGDEKVRWIDDAHLLHGKALFYKHEYLKARRKFEYVIREYDPPEQTEAMLWLGRTFIQLGYYDQAATHLDRLKNIIRNEDEEINSFTRSHLPLMYAELQLEQEKYESAVSHLLDGISLVNDSELKTRLMFIVAQVYQELGRDRLATDYFRDVLKRNPVYEMAFNAKIRLATSVDIDSERSDEVVEELQKMLKDSKNKEFQDQVYYALAEISRKKGNDTLAISRYRKSVAHSIENEYQRAQSSLKVADIFFDRKNYPMAKSYYDTALRVLPADYPNLMQIQRKSYTLSNLVDNLETVQLQDSLQQLATMSEAQRKKVIDSIIAAYQQEQRRMKEEEQARRQSAAAMQQNRMRSQSSGAQSAGGKWYFYNNTAKSRGYNEFVAKWGRRKLEDNWRRINKKSEASFGFEDQDMELIADTAGADTTQMVSTDPVKRDTYLQSIPLTEEALKESDTLIAEALYKIGFIYKIQLEDDREAIDAFSSFAERFPDYEKAVVVYYQLYQLYNKTGQTSKAEEVKQKILSDYPDTDYALILEDPDYFDRLQSDSKKLKAMYQESYNAYQQGSYLTAKLISEDAIKNYEETEITPRFRFLRAVALRRIENSKDTLRYELREIVKEYPQSEVFTLAQNILKKMEKDADTLSTDDKQERERQQQLEEAKKTFTENLKENHFYIMIVNSDSVKVSATKVRLADHNKKFFKNEGLKVSSVVYSGNKQMVTISDFNNSTEAMTYFRSVAKSDYIFSNIEDHHFRHYVISSQNYPKLYKQKNITDYHVFFESTYLKEGEYPKMGTME